MEKKNEILEIHYYTGSHEILFDTISSCNVFLKNIINELYKINNIDDIEIFLMPYENGCFKETIKIYGKKIEDTVIFALKCLIFKILIIDNLPTINLNINSIIGKNNIQSIGNNNTQNVNQDNYNTINKNRSNFYNTLKNDKYIEEYNDGKIEISYYDGKDLIVDSIYKNQFDNFIINENKTEFSIYGDGFIKLKSVILDSESNNQWSGVYCGKDIIDNNNIIILPINSQIGFYISDREFKNKIKNRTISFTSNDKIYVKYNIIYKKIEDEIKIIKFDVSEVLEFNDNIFKRYQKEQADNSLNQLPLFENF